MFASAKVISLLPLICDYCNIHLFMFLHRNKYLGSWSRHYLSILHLEGEEVYFPMHFWLIWRNIILMLKQSVLNKNQMTISAVIRCPDQTASPSIVNVVVGVLILWEKTLFLPSESSYVVLLKPLFGRASSHGGAPGAGLTSLTSTTTTSSPQFLVSVQKRQT